MPSLFCTTGVIDKVLNEMLVNPVQHGVAYAEFLAYKLHSSSPANEVKDPNVFFQQFRTLVNGIQPQELQYCGKAITHVSRQLTKMVLSMNCGMMAIGPLKVLVEKITGHTQHHLARSHFDHLDSMCSPFIACISLFSSRCYKYPNRRAC